LNWFWEVCTTSRQYFSVDNFVFSHNLSAWEGIDILWRNKILITHHFTMKLQVQVSMTGLQSHITWTEKLFALLYYDTHREYCKKVSGKTLWLFSENWWHKRMSQQMYIIPFFLTSLYLTISWSTIAENEHDTKVLFQTPLWVISGNERRRNEMSQG